MACKQRPPLSDLESKVMAVVWQRGQTTAETVRVTLQQTQPLKDSTIRTVLRRLEEKGYVRHETEGRTYLYSPVDVSQNVAADAVRTLIDRFCNGSVEALLVGMVDREVVSPAKLTELAERIAAEKTQRSKKTKNRSDT